MDTQTAVNFVKEQFPNARIYQQLERAPRGARQVWVYYSEYADGVGRIGRKLGAPSDYRRCAIRAS